MVSFVCDTCQDVLTKPKIRPHTNRCRYATFTCIDCNTHFNQNQDAFKHSSCITEAQKWHGKFGKGTPKKATPQSTPKSTPKAKSPVKSTPKSTPKKRAREDDIESPRGDSKRLKKKKSVKVLSSPRKGDALVVEQPIVTEFDLKDFPWKRTQAKHIHLAKKSKVDIATLQTSVVDEFLEQMRPSLESMFITKLHNNSKVTLVKDGKKVKIASE
eukprot:TRINITY_DN963_c1_g1_i1.p1 TRINITY_DN963_c1_g1~~TRINITY_DN963_c1_g1_i1.p1  ORF type:complete len:246 (-),score=70.70 TRINITY_DN963_c1_g1_i1:29-670(-)